MSDRRGPNLFSPPGAIARDGGRRAELQLWALSVGATTWMIDLQPYEVSRVAGLVQHLRLDPANGCIEATVGDGTGLVVARWTIRRPMSELAAAPGQGVILEGVPVRDICVEFVYVDPTLTFARFPQVA